MINLNEQEAVDYIFSSFGTGKIHGQAAVLNVLRQLGNPHEKLKIIHVAGTNGKGSVCAMISQILFTSGRKTGFFSSPHLNKINERFRINGLEITNSELADQVNRLRRAQFHTFGNEKDCLSYFEFLTVLSFNYFIDQNVDIAVIETGLGGRLDSTNVITQPLLSVITSISLDHTETLGQTVELIAAEKGGIIKKNCPVLLYFQKESVYNTIKEICKLNHSCLFYNNFEADIISSSYDEICFNLRFMDYSLKNIHLKLIGEFQIFNAVLAIQAVKLLNDFYVYNICDEIIKIGISKTEWPARFELLSRNPLFVLDGAHNIDAVSKLIFSITKLFPKRKITLLSAVLKDKQVSEMINILAEISEIIVLTKPNNNLRAVEPELLADEIINKSGKVILIESDVLRAVNTAIAMTDSNGLILCCGSLYLAGDVREIFLDKSAIK